jgi:hypothetical protein
MLKVTICNKTLNSFAWLSFAILPCIPCGAQQQSPIPLATVKASSANEFLNSIGVCVHVQHGQNAAKLVPLLKYTGIRNVRDGADKNYDLAGLILLHQQAGERIVFGPASGAHDADLPSTIEAARKLDAAGALLAIEGPNEPNNFGGVTYQGVSSAAAKGTWMPVAKFQRDLYAAVKTDSVLSKYPVFSESETGAETDNVGLQFLTIPAGANALLPDGTRFADYLNVHNYMYHDGMWPGSPHDNQVWNAADPTPASRVDGLYNNHGLTWRNHYKGYSVADLAKLPRVTTETGTAIKGAITEDIQADNYLNVYLAQFKRGWSYTFIYEFLDDADGSYGFYKDDYATARKSAVYLHNMTTILADKRPVPSLKTLRYAIPQQPETTHDLLLQKSNGNLDLVLWSERVSGQNDLKLNLGQNYKSVSIYDPTIGIAAIRSLRDVKSVHLTLSNHPVIIELSSH